MAVSENPFRSISLPSRLNPINSTEFESHLQKLKAFPIISSKAIQISLLGLEEIYSSVQKLTQSPFLILQHHQDGKSVERSLEGSIELLDSCNTVRELVQMIKENAKALQSAFQRKGLDSNSLNHDLNSYFALRKKMNKCVYKGLKTLKNLESNNRSNVVSTNGDECFIRVSREVNGLTIASLKGILDFLYWPTTKTRGWNLVCKLMMTKSVACGRDQSVINEMESVDFSLSILLRRIKDSNYSILDMQKRLRNLDCCLEGIEGGLERLFRQLVQNRVTLLNILTDH